MKPMVGRAITPCLECRSYYALNCKACPRFPYQESEKIYPLSQSPSRSLAIPQIAAIGNTNGAAAIAADVNAAPA